MTAAFVIASALHGAGMAARLLASVMAILLIARSVHATYFPFSEGRLPRVLNELTGMLVEPVRTLLPRPLCGRRPDYASLATAIGLLLLGFGMSEICMMMERSL